MSDTANTLSYSREELIHYADQYLDALVADDPSILPITDDVKFTENAKILSLGEGIWETASGISYRHYVADRFQGQIGFFGTVQEGEELSLLALRLKISNKKISEIETIVARDRGRSVAFRPDLLIAPQSVFTELVPESERLPRDQMIATADLYFQGIKQHTGDIIPFTHDCNRIENGLQTTNNPELGQITSLACSDQIPYFGYITHIRDRRYKVVDEERGLVWMMVMFDNNGTVKTINIPGRGTVEVRKSRQVAGSALLAELFKIKNGKIHQIEAILTGVPFGVPSGW